MLYILMGLCAIALWLFAYLGIRNYAYDHSEPMNGAKIIVHSILILFFACMALKLFL